MAINRAKIKELLEIHQFEDLFIEELGCIINYDIRYRMGKDLAKEDSGEYNKQR